MRKRITSALLTLVMLLSLIPAMGTTAQAANGPPKAGDVLVDDEKNFYDGAGNRNQLYYRNGDEADKFTGTEGNYNAHYNPNTGVLTLNNYKGKHITVGGTDKADIIIELVGENIVNGFVKSDMGGDITIKGSGSLKVTNAESGNGDVYGIAAGYGNLPTGNVAITESATVTIDATNHYNGPRLAYGIFARQSITISDSASVDITCSAPSSTTSESSCYGMYVPPATSDGRVTIDTKGKIQINVTKAGGSSYSCGVSAPHYTLTKVGSMEVQWKKKSGTGSGAPFTGSASFDTNTHAVNIDTTNCYASYRSGTPHRVDAVNGTLEGPGVVANANNYGYFLAGDTVKLTAPTRYADSDNTVEIPFDKWVSDDVTITDGSSQAVSFEMPSKDVAVRANYNPFATQPSFIKDSSYATKGTIPLKLISENFDPTGGGINIYRASDLTKVNSSYIKSGTQITITVFETSCPKGEYVVGVSYSKVMCYSEPFTVKYTTPSAAVAEDVTVSGKAGTAVNGTVTITLKNDKFADPLPPDGEWIQNLPAGLNQSVECTDDQTATITISGVPQMASTEIMEIIIPAGALADESGTPVVVSVGGKARFNITSNAPTAENIQIGDYNSTTKVNNKFSKEKPYYKNGTDGAFGGFTGTASDYNAKYDPQTGTLTLKDYDGPYIKIDGNASQTVTVKLMGSGNKVRSEWYHAIELVGGVNLIVTADADANLILTAGNKYCGIGSASDSDVGSVTISGSANVTINASTDNSSFAAYGIRSGKDVAVLGNASLKITSSSDGGTEKGYGIYTPSGKVTVDTTGTVDIDVSGCANSDTYCISASSIEFKKAETITLKYIPAYSWSTPTYPKNPDASDMKSPKTTTDSASNVTTVTYAKLGAQPDKPRIKLPSNNTTDITGENFLVTLEHDDPSVKIYYTTDGTSPTTDGKTPTKDSIQYEAPFNVGKSCTVKAVAYSEEDEQCSDVVEQVLKWHRYKITKMTAGVSVCDEHGNLFTDGIEPGTKVYIKAPLTRTSTSGEEQIFDSWNNISNTTIDDTSASETYFIMPYQDITITAKYVAKPAGVTVSGTAVSWNGNDDAEYYLYPADMEDTAIRAQWKKDVAVSGYYNEYTVTKGSVTANADGKRYDQIFSFSAVPAGDYKLVIFKPEKYVPKIVEITVGTSDYNCGEQKLWLYGDVNYDGKIRTGDATQINLYLAGERAFSDDEFASADITGDGKIRTGDATQIYLKLAGDVSKFDDIK